jgi:hypothetical protein
MAGRDMIESDDAAEHTGPCAICGALALDHRTLEIPDFFSREYWRTYRPMCPECTEREARRQQPAPWKGEQSPPVPPAPPIRPR